MLHARMIPWTMLSPPLSGARHFARLRFCRTDEAGRRLRTRTTYDGCEASLKDHYCPTAACRQVFAYVGLLLQSSQSSKDIDRRQSAKSGHEPAIFKNQHISVFTLRPLFENGCIFTKIKITEPNRENPSS